ncbi:MAG: PhzF family phenazine biosynthesis protein [Nakamurella sp.]
MKIRLFQIDAFADQLFQGNPAAVMPLPHWLDDQTLQQLASENNLSETAFYVERLPDGVIPLGDGPAYHLRWFTPATEVDLCGHATLATAAQLFEDVHPDERRLQFWTRSGWLTTDRADNGAIVMDFPAEPLVRVERDPLIESALGASATKAFRGTDLIYVLESPEIVKGLVPDFTMLGRLDVRGLIVTARGGDKGVDFVSRWFGALAGIAEDPVTGSAHSQIAPYWAREIGRNTLTARQLSPRGGTVHCTVIGERVQLAGTYRRYLDGTVTIP